MKYLIFAKIWSNLDSFEMVNSWFPGWGQATFLHVVRNLLRYKGLGVGLLVLVIVWPIHLPVLRSLVFSLVAFLILVPGNFYHVYMSQRRNAPKSYENNWLQTDFKNETTSKKPIYNGGIFSENASVGIHSLVIFCRGNDISHSSSSSFPDFGPKRASCFHKALQVHEKKLGWKNLCKPIKRMEFPVEYTVCI